jgi:tRNA nucleotidyltransferase (CCA-adding enzyme)
MRDVPSILGATFYLVGGSVRDTLLGRISKDEDYVVVTEMSFDELATEMECAGATIFVRKPEFLTMRVRYGGAVFDVTFPRVDGEYKDGRRPSVVTLADSLKQDAARRDFTINAMYLDAYGVVKDFYGGRQDLEQKVIRAVGDPDERFKEDYLRILRAVRFSCTLGFTIDHATFHAMYAHVNGLETISADRIREELNRSLAADPERTLSFLLLSGALPILERKGLTFQVTQRVV